jgi:hypothetical protein
LRKSEEAPSVAGSFLALDTKAAHRYMAAIPETSSMLRMARLKKPGRRMRIIARMPAMAAMEALK